ncbi:rod shape-determining protein MreC [Agrilactobacillus fermenti]|uniref:rod shape-determining protein MreC n=1 Tax=Agrilactobacillus fermenti TaxID=2586909 RepID=UPI001E591BD0|nr:rod shape-determining protein MreC [Agrilactobacillus fermenti]MCD2256483.1 rod shape-determining protein MreC [Agrilactobacillus fermenti]
MSKFFSNKKLIILLITIVAMIGFISISISIRDRRETPPVIQQIGNDAAGIASQIVSAPVNSIRTGLTSMVNLVNTYQDNERLKQQLDQLDQVKETNTTLRRENKALKRQLKLSATLTDYKEMNAAVISRSPASWQNQVVINKGQLNGVVKNMPVMSGSGLLGRVVEVNKTNSKVELISTDNKNTNRFAVEVKIGADKYLSGIVSRYNSAQHRLIISQLDTTEGVKAGDMVSTSGLGGLTPRGLFVGKVTSVRKDDYGLTNSVYVKPAANIDDFTVVTLIDRTVAGD